MPRIIEAVIGCEVAHCPGNYRPDGGRCFVDDAMSQEPTAVTAANTVAVAGEGFASCPKQSECIALHRANLEKAKKILRSQSNP